MFAGAMAAAAGDAGGIPRPTLSRMPSLNRQSTFEMVLLSTAEDEELVRPLLNPEIKPVDRKIRSTLPVEKMQKKIIFGTPRPAADADTTDAAAAAADTAAAAVDEEEKKRQQYQDEKKALPYGGDMQVSALGGETRAKAYGLQINALCLCM
jgi:hypothetical protein